MKNKQIEQWLSDEGACSDAVEWVEELDPDTFAYAWDRCVMTEWKIWAIRTLNVMPDCTCGDGDCPHLQVIDDPDLRRDAAIAAFEAVISPTTRLNWSESRPATTDTLPDECDAKQPLGYLSPDQDRIIKAWAADDRLWSTQETVEINLRTFARVILSLEVPR